MAINLRKNETINLVKDNKESLKKVMVGLGWDEAERKSGLFGRFHPQEEFDCDASAVLCVNGRFENAERDLIFYNHLRHESDAVVHQGDNRTGEGEGDDEQIFVDLEKIPARYDRIVFVVTIYMAQERRQHFGMIENAFIRICDGATEKEFCRYDLTEDFKGKTALCAGELIRRGGSWTFRAVGQGTNDGDVLAIANRFKY